MADRPADKLAGEGSFADKLRRRREALEAGDATGGAAFGEQPNYKDISVDGAVNNQKSTLDEAELRKK